MSRRLPHPENRSWRVMPSPLPPLASLPQPQRQDALPTPQHTSRPNTTIISRPQPPYTQSASVLSTNASSTPALDRNTKAASAATRPDATREHITHLPYNPSRPPPHTYTRQHEFPPFPPLAQHPVLPFLTTAFANTQESHAALTTNPRPAFTRLNSVGRPNQSTLSTIPTMDVNKNDPTAVFIRVPLVVPFSRTSDPSINPSCLNSSTLDGEPAPGTPLTYAILHAHRNWFLDPEDFHKDNPNRIDYPHELEPPRGWAPLPECTGPGAANRCKQAKEKKEKNNGVRTKGSYGQGDNAQADATTEYGPSDDSHEKTVLRCTFCRREYHGPNAKSMWRRHVYDKHKVAMKNRREGSAGMAPRTMQAQKKAKMKTAEATTLGPPVDVQTSLTLDLTNEQNLFRLIDRVLSGDISLPNSILNLPGNDSAVNLEAILQQSGITQDGSPSTPLVFPHITSTSSNLGVGEKTTSKLRKRDEQRRERERRDEEIVMAAAGPSYGVDDEQHNSSAPPPTIQHTSWGSQPDLPIYATSSSPVRVSDAEATRLGTKHEAEELQSGRAFPTLPNLERPPLKDNTVLDRSSHNRATRPIPGTPRNNKGKGKALPTTPGVPKLSQGSFLSSPPSPKQPYTPMKPPSALRSRALATTGEESYLTLIVSSPASVSPGRTNNRVLLTSPLHHSTSPTKRSDRNRLPTSEDTLGNPTVSSPSYPFEFNIPGFQSSPSVPAFESIPLELGYVRPAPWTPPSLGPRVPVSEPTSHSISRASSTRDGIDLYDKIKSQDDGDEFVLDYPDWSSPSKRNQHCRRSSPEEFDMDAYLDLEDAGPPSQSSTPPSPNKNAITHGLQFSKEFGLLSPSEVERITASVQPGFSEDARSSKRRKVDVP